MRDDSQHFRGAATNLAGCRLFRACEVFYVHKRNSGRKTINLNSARETETGEENRRWTTMDDDKLQPGRLTQRVKVWLLANRFLSASMVVYLRFKCRFQDQYSS